MNACCVQYASTQKRTPCLPPRAGTPARAAAETLRRAGPAEDVPKAFTVDAALELKRIQMGIFSLEDASLPFAEPDSNFCSTFSGASESGGTQGPRLKPVGFRKFLSFVRIKPHSLALGRSPLLSEPVKSFSTLSVLFHPL